MKVRLSSRALVIASWLNQDEGQVLDSNLVYCNIRNAVEARAKPAAIVPAVRVLPAIRDDGSFTMKLNFNTVFV